MFLLNLQSKEPIQDQIKHQLIRFIEAGVLKQDDRLPSVRQLAQDNGINPNTVMKAYSDLEQAGFVYNLPKKGVYVAKVDVEKSLEDQLLELLRPFKEQGFNQDRMNQVIQKLFKEEEDVSHS